MRFSNFSSGASLLLILVAGCGSSNGNGSGGGGGSNASGGGGPGGGTASGGGGAGTGGSATGGGDTGPEVIFPRTGITPDQVGVLVNDDDPLSVEVGKYYVKARKIPAGNVVHLKVGAAMPSTINAAAFAPLKTQVDTAFKDTDVQALAITWTKPFGVDNMSITSAFALGAKTIGDTCNDPMSQAGTPNPYSTKMGSTQPFTDLAFRPAMTIPATKIEEAKAIIDRGVASDDTWPTGSAYMMDTSDQIRSARCVVSAMYGYTNECQHLIDVWDSAKSGVDATIVMADSVTNKTDVLFYVQGLASVPDLTTNTYLPGAIGDHLTSYGGQIPTSGQMSCFQFLLAGTTGSFGTVVEPCAYTQKFPDPTILMPQYFGGATLIEAYWKSVAWPAEGIFVGEPLARPWGTGFHSNYADGTLTIETTTMAPGHMYVIEAGDSAKGPFDPVMDGLSIPKYQKATFTLKKANRKTYRFREAS